MYKRIISINTNKNNLFCWFELAIKFKIISVQRYIKDTDPILPPFINQETESRINTVVADNQILQYLRNRDKQYRKISTAEEKTVNRFNANGKPSQKLKIQLSTDTMAAENRNVSEVICSKEKLFFSFAIGKFIMSLNHLK